MRPRYWLAVPEHSTRVPSRTENETQRHREPKEDRQECLSHILKLYTAAVKSLLLRWRELAHRSSILGILYEQGKPLAFCFFLFCGDDPISAHSLVPRRLRTENSQAALLARNCFACSRVNRAVLRRNCRWQTSFHCERQTL